MDSRTSRRSPEMTTWLWLIVILPSTCGFTFTTSVSEYSSVQGASVTLGCKFSLAPDEMGHLEIKWTFRPPAGRERLLLWYAGESVLDHSGSKGRIHFDILDPQDGDASLMFQDLKVADTGTYQCKVKTSTGLESKTMRLTVINEAPKLKCSVSGDTMVSNDVTLQCKFSEDTESRGFFWKKISGDGRFPRFSSLDKTQGNLTIKYLRERDAGTYRCTAESPISVEHCDVILQIKPYEFTVASVITPTTIFLIVVNSAVIIAVIICCFCRRKCI